MKYKLSAPLLALLTVLALTVPVSADVIWEPQDSFYEKHREECDYVNRSYELAGYDGNVTVFTAPGGSNKATLDNGAQGTIQFTWNDNGTVWGYLCWVSDSNVEGWVPMDDLSLVYDSQQFMEDYAGEIAETSPVPVDFHEAVLYNYPNGTSGTTLEEEPEYMSFSETFTQLYTDKNGLRWGYISYYMGMREYWVCLDDPMNGALNTGIVPVSPSPAQVRGSATVTAGPPVILIAAGLVAAVAAATVILLLKQNRRSCPKHSAQF